MSSTMLTVRVDSGIKKRLDKLAKSTGRSRSVLVAEAIGECFNVSEWQVAGIKRAMASMDRGKGVPHQKVVKWVRPLRCGETKAPRKFRSR